MKHKNNFASVTVRVTCMCLDKAHHAPETHRSKKLIRFLDSFILLPVLTVSLPLGGLAGVVKTDIGTNAPKVVLSQQQNIAGDKLLALNEAEVLDQKAKTLEAEAKAIDAYFEARDMPLEGTGQKMAEEADKNGLDWRLMPAIAVRESTGGKHDCVKVKNNPFGWGSCKISFESNDKAIETIARNLGGNNPNTKQHYSGKTTKEILQKYNPPSVVPNYAPQVMAIMNIIGTADVVIVDETTT